MITKIELINYKSHANTTINLEQLVGIIGENDAGKSSIIKAIDTVVNNKNWPVDHLRHGSNDGSITITFKDGRSIARYRDRKSQALILTDAQGKRTEYKGKAKLDDIVADFTGFRQVVLDKNTGPEDLQIIPSDEQNFLISGTSPEGVMRRLIKLMSGMGVETAKVNLQGKQRALKAELEVQDRLNEVHLNKLAVLKDEIWELLVDKWVAIEYITGDILVLQHEIKQLEKLTTIVVNQKELKEIEHNCDGYHEWLELHVKEMSIHIEEIKREIGILSNLVSMRAELADLEKMLELQKKEGVCPKCGYVQ